jgi:hypothetical protein
VPIRKCPGVKTFRSLGSSVSGHKGRELRQALIPVNNVYISSYVNEVWPITRLICPFTALIPASQRPPK